MLPLMCCPEPACDPKPASKMSPRSGPGFGQAWEAAGIPVCLQYGQAGYEQLLIKHKKAARQLIPGIPHHQCVVRAPWGADAGGWHC